MTTGFFAILAVFTVLALLETPIFVLIAGISVVCLYAVDHDPLALQTVLIEMNRLASMPVLVALPLFTFVGALLTATEAPRRIMAFMQALFGWMPGGLAVAALISCALFTALTGASGVTIVALGGVLYPVLRKYRHPKRFSLGLLTTSGSLGLLFPPSLPIILYGVVAQVDIADLFLAALVPGILLVAVISSYAVLHETSRRRSGAETASRDPFSGRRLLKAARAAAWDLPVIGITLVGVYGGYVTIAEVSALVLVYAVVVECFVLREVRFFRQLPAIVVESCLLSGAIIVILGFSLGFTGYLVDQQIPSRILELMTGWTDNRWVFLAGLNGFLLLVGCFMDVFSAIVIIVPIIVPIALTYGIDPFHLGVIFLINLEIGYSTPPIGMNLFIASMKFRQPVTQLYRASLPYLVWMLVVLVLVTYVPAISLLALR
ncbi:MAG: TRAP transporter large permease subunit [Desulfobacteraceae bacterium]|nr:TRAP transporter large permease subunit [Desulfobacteraceae bacterium]